MSRVVRDAATSTGNLKRATQAVLAEVWDLAARMRIAQAGFFAGRAQEALEEAKRLERELDSILFRSMDGQGGFDL